MRHDILGDLPRRPPDHMLLAILLAVLVMFVVVPAFAPNIHAPVAGACR